MDVDRKDESDGAITPAQLFTGLLLVLGKARERNVLILLEENFPL